MISFTITTQRLFWWHLMRDTISRHFTRHAMKVGLEILLLIFRTSRILYETGLKLRFFLNFCHNCFSILETLSSPCYIDTLPSLVLQYKHIPIYIYPCMGGIHINLLSCKTSFWHFGEWVSFEKICLKFCCGKMLKYIITEFWLCLSCIVHSLNLANKNWRNTYKVIPKRYSSFLH